MRLWAILIFLVLTGAAQAQSGSAKTTTTLNAEVNAFFLDNNSGQITPLNARQTLLDIIASSCNSLTPANCPGGDANVLNTQTSNYAVATSDCGKIIQAGTGSTGKFTITLPSVSGFATNCSVLIKNGDTGRAKILTGFPVDLATLLWPGQSVGVKIVNGAWASFYNPGRWRLSGDTTFFINSAIGSDANDGLAAGAGNAWQTFAIANFVINSYIDLNSYTVTLQGTAGQTYNNIQFFGPNVGPGNVIIDLAGGTATTSIGNPAVYLTGSRINGSITFQNGTVTCGGGPLNYGILVTGGLGVLGTGITFGACAGGIHRVAAYGAVMSAVNNYTISGGAAAHMYADALSLQDDINVITVTLTGTPNFTTAFNWTVLNGASVVVAANVTYSGAATGKRYLATGSGFIATQGGGPNFFPGDAPGQVTTGARYDSPGTPIISACGTSPSAAGGNDLGGLVVEGTNATGCTITFTTANAPAACSVNLSTGAAVGVATLNATTLTVVHANLTNNVLYWQCVPP